MDTEFSLHERLTRSLAYMLRHQPEEFDLVLDKHGWGNLGDVVQALGDRLDESVEEEDVNEALAGADRVRYEIKDGRIRALYGHSIEVDPGEPDEPPDELFATVRGRDVPNVERDGLKSVRRSHLHLSLTEDEGREVGRRLDRRYAVIRVLAGDAWEDGIDFYDRGAIFLSEEIPIEFIDEIEEYDDGVERERPGGRGRGGRDQDRGRGRGGRGGRDQGRGRGGRGRDQGRGRDNDGDRGRNESRGRSQPRDDRDEDRPKRDDRSQSDERPKRESRPRSDDRPKRDDRPRNDDRPKREDRPRSDDRPRNDDRPRREDRPRSDDRPKREDRPRSDDRPKREDREERKPAAKRESNSGSGSSVDEPRAKPAPKPAPKKVEAPASPSAGFGAGIE